MLPPVGHNLCALVNPIILPYPFGDERTLLVFTTVRSFPVVCLLKVLVPISWSNSFFMVLFICFHIKKKKLFCFDMFCVNKLIIELNNENNFFFFSVRNVFLSFCCCWKPERLEFFFSLLFYSRHISTLNCTFPLYFIWVIKALWRLKIISPQIYAKQTGTFHTKSSEFEWNRWKLWKWTHFGKSTSNRNNAVTNHSHA